MISIKKYKNVWIDYAMIHVHTKFEVEQNIMQEEKERQTQHIIGSADLSGALFR